MINLLPDEIKQNIIFARRNSQLRRWSSLFILSAVAVGVITLFGLFYIHQNINSYSGQISKTQKELDDQHIDDVNKQVQGISDNLKLVVKVLSREVLFSKLIKQIAQAIPNNAILTNLQIAKTEGGIDLAASTTDYATATQVQVNLQDPSNKIFDKADIINISCAKPDPAKVVHYPCTVTIRAQFAKTNPFLFINSGAQK